jgi:hypothetical protein
LILLNMKIADDKILKQLTIPSPINNNKEMK